MTECTEEEVQRMLPQVSAQRREQALRYKHTLGQFCCLKSWLMLSALHIGEMEFLYNEHGKPYLAGGPYFSISHCKEGIAVALDDEPIGIDIESIRHADEELIRRTMNEIEQQQIHSNRDFTRLWTQKEAVVKMLGTGIESFEQLQNILSESRDHEITRSRNNSALNGLRIETIEKEKYIYSIAYGKLCSISA